MKNPSRIHPLTALACVALTAAPAHAALLVFDDFSTYTDGQIAGQAGTPTGFGGTWTSANPAVSAATTVSAGVVTSSGYGDRTVRTLSPTIAAGTIYLRVNMAIANAPTSFTALELATNAASDVNSVRLVGLFGNLYLDANGAGGASTGTIILNDGLSHEWLLELNFANGAGKVWIDPNLASFNPATGGTSFTAPTAFSLNAIQLATFQGADIPSLVLDDLQIGGSWENFFPTGEFQLTITPNSTNPGNYDFTWDSRPGMAYDLVSATDLSNPISTWAVWDGKANLSATPPTNTLANIPGGGDPRRFFAVIQKAPMPLLSANFEANNGGFTVSTATGSPWQWGTPISTDNGGAPNLGGSVTSGNGGSTQCWGTNIGNPGYYADPTTTRLRSPVIDLSSVSGATLSFAQALDLEAADSAVVNIINATTDAIIAAAIHTTTDADFESANWTTVNGISLAAGIGQQVRIEWVLSGTGGSSNDFMGWYIDDVLIDAQ